MRDCIELWGRAIRSQLVAEDGQTMPEYALLVVFIAMVAVAAVQTLGGNVVTFFTTAAHAV